MNRMSMYVQTKMTSTSMTIPKVIQVVERPLLDTEDRCFLDDSVAVRLPLYQLCALGAYRRCAESAAQAAKLTL